MKSCNYSKQLKEQRRRKIVKCTCGHETGTSQTCPNCGLPIQNENETPASQGKGVTKKLILSILAVCLVIAACGYYFKTVYQPNQRLTMAVTLLDDGQQSEADEMLQSFITDYPQHAKVPFAYEKLFELNFNDKAKSREILQILKEQYPHSDEYANSLTKSSAQEIGTFEPLYNDYFNTGFGKDKYYADAKSLLNELNTLSDSSAFITAGGKDLISHLNGIVNPSFGAIEFKLALSDYNKILSVTPADEPKVTLTSSDGTTAKVQYDKKTGVISSNDLAQGNYVLDVSLKRTTGEYLGGEELTILPGRKYKDTTYLFMKNKSGVSPDNIDRRYLALENNMRSISANQITKSADSPVPTEINDEVLPTGYSIPENDHYLFDLDNDSLNELIAYYHKTRTLAILHWTGKTFDKQAIFQIGGSDSKLDFAMYPISIKLYNLEGIPCPVLGLITTSGETGSYPELTLVTWNGKDGYDILWDATAGDHGDWQISKNKIVMSQDNFSVKTQTGAETRFIQEYEYNGTTFVLSNAYSSAKR